MARIVEHAKKSLLNQSTLHGVRIRADGWIDGRNTSSQLHHSITNHGLLFQVEPAILFPIHNLPPFVFFIFT